MKARDMKSPPPLTFTLPTPAPPGDMKSPPPLTFTLPTPAPPDPELLNEGKECWSNCYGITGRCNWCGSGSCCRIGFEGDGCSASTGCPNNHCCTQSSDMKRPPPLTFTLPTPAPPGDKKPPQRPVKPVRSSTTTTTPTPTTPAPKKAKACRKACTKEIDPVCASNGDTYLNKCVFLKAACQLEQNNQVITILYAGYCKKMEKENKGGLDKREGENDENEGDFSEFIEEEYEGEEHDGEEHDGEEHDGEEDEGEEDEGEEHDGEEDEGEEHDGEEDEGEEHEG